MAGHSIQRVVADRNSVLPENRRMAFRIAISLDDAIIEGYGIYGGGVNGASRLERPAETGGVCVAVSSMLG